MVCDEGVARWCVMRVWPDEGVARWCVMRVWPDGV